MTLTGYNSQTNNANEAKSFEFFEYFFIDARKFRRHLRDLENLSFWPNTSYLFLFFSNFLINLTFVYVNVQILNFLVFFSPRFDAKTGDLDMAVK